MDDVGAVTRWNLNDDGAKMERVHVDVLGMTFWAHFRVVSRIICIVTLLWYSFRSSCQTKTGMIECDCEKEVRESFEKDEKTVS